MHMSAIIQTNMVHPVTLGKGLNGETGRNTVERTGGKAKEEKAEAINIDGRKVGEK